MPVFRECWYIVARRGVWKRRTWLGSMGRAERMMVRRMCVFLSVFKEDRKHSWGPPPHENPSQIESFGHQRSVHSQCRGQDPESAGWDANWADVERFKKEENNCRWRKGTRMNVTGVVGRGAPRKTWRSCVKRNMKDMGIKKEMAQDRCAWRNITGGPTHASADAWHISCVFGVTGVKRIWWWRWWWWLFT